MSGQDATGMNPYAESSPGAGSETHPAVPSAGQNRPRTAGGRSRLRFPTAILLTCAALGVAGGILLAPANWISTILFPGLPFVSVGLAGLWLLPSVVALRLLLDPANPLRRAVTGWIAAAAAPAQASPPPLQIAAWNPLTSGGRAAISAHP